MDLLIILLVLSSFLGFGSFWFFLPNKDEIDTNPYS